MEIADTIFRRKTYDAQSLLNYGFIKNGNTFTYSTQISDGQFLVEVKISENSIRSDVIEIATGEPFTLYHIDGAGGAFVGQIKSDAEAVLKDICEKCFYREIFKNRQTKLVINYGVQKYSTHEEYLWDKFPDNAVLRRSDNKKWYAALLTVEKKKLGLDGEGVIEVIDLRGEPAEIDRLVDGKIYFRGYHMNKTHWYTIPLDNSVSDEELIERIDKSFILAR